MTNGAGQATGATEAAHLTAGPEALEAARAPGAAKATDGAHSVAVVARCGSKRASDPTAEHTTSSLLSDAGVEV